MKKLYKQLDESIKKTESIKEKLFSAWAEKLNKDDSIKKIIECFENCDGGSYEWDRFECGQIMYCMIIQHELLNTDTLEYFEHYFNDYGYYLNFESSLSEYILSQFNCGYIINIDGDVYDPDNEFFINNSDYETKRELYELIEARMKSSGDYSGVFRDNHGMIEPVNTQYYKKVVKK